MKARMIRPQAYAPGEFSDLAAASPMLPRQFTITDLTWETGEGDVFTWQLEPADGSALGFRLGQFNMLYQFGVGEVPISISGDSETGELAHTIRAVGAVTKGLQRLRPGDGIGIRGPFGSHWPMEQAFGRDLVILAGGIGLAPMRPVVLYARRHRALFGRVFLLYGTRTPLDIIYRQELEAWQLEGRVHVDITVDRSGGHWQGNVGVVTNLLEHLDLVPHDSIAMVCGPEIMMHFAQLSLQKIGLLPSQIFLSLERNMRCAVGLCGHCQWGPHFICKDGPIFRLDQIEGLLEVREL